MTKTAAELEKFRWTKKHGDNYRKIYDSLSWERNRDLIDSVQAHNIQVSQYPAFLLRCLDQIKQKELRVAELGGFDGYQALTVMESVDKKFCWVNYDLSRIAVLLTQKGLKKHNYHIILLDKPFCETEIVPESFDLFYSSKTLEHVKLQEALAIITHMRRCIYQIHIVDWFKADDMHVIEDGCHNKIKMHLISLGYTLRHCLETPASSLFFAERT